VDRDSPVGFTAWAGPHLDAMSRLAIRLSARGDDMEDVVQDALALAWSRRAQYDPDRGSAKNWLLAITANVARDHERARLRRQRVVDDRWDVDDARHMAAPARDAAADLTIAAAIRALPERQCLAVTLFYYLGLNVADTADAMGCSVGTVKSTLSVARSRLKSTLGDE
jgi:RNA polymerase sigma-70 factor (ECF subfamily)